MIKKEKQCIICETNQAICTLKEIIEDPESAEQVKFQAKALLELHFELDDHFCEECFWK